MVPRRADNFRDAIQQQPNLYVLLGERARQHSALHLAAETALAGGIGLICFLERSSWWPVYLPLLVVASYSLWGVLDRIVSAIPSGRPAARVTRQVVLAVDWIIVAVATLSVATLFFLVFGYFVFAGWIH